MQRTMGGRGGALHVFICLYERESQTEKKGGRGETFPCIGSGRDS